MNNPTIHRSFIICLVYHNQETDTYSKVVYKLEADSLHTAILYYMDRISDCFDFCIYDEQYDDYVERHNIDQRLMQCSLANNFCEYVEKYN